jgi:PAS domain S-box-containing protein
MNFFSSSPKKIFLGGVTIVTTIFILEVALPHYVLPTVGYVIAIIYILGFPRKGQHATWLGILTTCFIVAGYLWKLEDFVDQPSVTLNRALAILATWLAVIINIRQRKMQEDEAKVKDKLNAVFNNATEGMLVINKKGEITLANPSAEQMFGYPKNGLLNLAIETLLPKELKSIHERHRHTYMAKPRNRPMGMGLELVARRKDGSEFPVEISLSHFENEEGQFAIAFVLDMSERKKALETLAQERAISHTYFELAPVLFIALDKYGNVTSINDYGSTVLGYTKKEIIGANWFARFIAPNIRDELLEYFEKIVSGKVSLDRMHYENPIINKQGEEIEISWRNTILRDLENNPIGVLSAGSDVTEKKKQERMIIAHHAAIQNLNEQLEVKIRNRTSELNEAVHKLEKANRFLESNHKLFKAVAHHFPKGVIGVLNKDMKFIFADGQELQSLDKSHAQFSGERHLFDLHPSLYGNTEEKFKSVFGGANVSFDVELEKKFFTVNAAPLPDEHGNILEILLVIKNITERKKAEKDLLKSIEKERELSMMKSKFVTMASHEFRTPLTTILSSVFLLENYSAEDMERNKSIHLSKIKRSVNNLTELLNDFISMGKLEEGKVKPAYTEINIKDFLNDLVPDMEHIRKGNQRIQCEYSGELDTIMLDKQLLRSIVLNLIGNAVKYSPIDAKILVTASISTNGLSLKVIDHGMGIPEEDQSHIFKRFYRAQNAVNIQGTGLGLNISRKYARLMKGKIEFESSLDRGTTFTVTIPNYKYPSEPLTIDEHKGKKNIHHTHESQQP